MYYREISFFVSHFIILEFHILYLDHILFPNSSQILLLPPHATSCILSPLKHKQIAKETQYQQTTAMPPATYTKPYNLYMLGRYSWAWGLPWNVIDIFTIIPLKKNGSSQQLLKNNIFPWIYDLSTLWFLAPLTIWGLSSFSWSGL